MNKLPEKLTLLRKHKNLSQGDLAKKINVPVTEYMQWENGNKICTILQLKQLADIFDVSLDDLADNTKEVLLSENILDESVTIPFNMGADINATQIVGASSMENTVQTAQLDMENVMPASNDGETRVVDPAALSSSEEYDDYEDDEEEEEIRPKKKKKTANKKKQSSSKKKKQSMIIIGSVCAVVVVVLAVLLFMNMGGSSLSVGSDNRIAVGDTYTLYVDNKGSVNKYGNFSTNESFSSAVQVSAFDDHAVLLKSDGTVVSSDGNSEVSQWKDITSIAAGENHTVGLKDNGEVVCAGSENACEVSGWSDIASVYAGDEITIGLTSDGEVKTSGGNATAVNGQTDVRHVGVSSNLIVLTKKDGTVSVYPIGSVNASLSTSGWSDIQSTAVGSNLIAGLKKDGTVELAYSDEDVVTKVSSWKNIKYLAANGSTLVGINASGNMYGAGDNTYNQYVDSSSSSETEETEDPSGELDEAKNITITTTSANVVIKWDTVENADYYEVSLNTSPAKQTKTTSNSTSIAASSLEDGEEYVVTVTAKSNDDDKYTESSATKTFTYTAKTVQLETPTGIKATATDSQGLIIEWDAVEHADEYILNINNSGEFTCDTNSYACGAGISPGDTFTVTIKAASKNSMYKQSEEAQAMLQYEMQTTSITLFFTYEDGTSTGNTMAVQNVYVGQTYDSQTLATMAGYDNSKGTVVSSSITIKSGVTQYEIKIKKQETTGDNTDSDSTNNTNQSS